MTAARRVVVVLGYAAGGHRQLHPVCAARLGRAAEVATDADVVVLSGWSRDGVAEPEALLMQRAWTGRAAEVVVDPVASTTVENALLALDDVVRSGAREVVVVTSAWHAARARAAFRLVLLGRGVRVSSAAAPASASLRVRLRELALGPLLPGQLWAARRRARRRGRR
ncbi:MAG: YdcF family protein [Thermoleophilia bacterium]